MSFWKLVLMLEICVVLATLWLVSDGTIPVEDGKKYITTALIGMPITLIIDSITSKLPSKSNRW